MPHVPREYIRHTAGVPIDVRSVGAGTRQLRKTVNVSFGGLAFMADEPLEPGATVELRIEQVRPPFEARALVAWCRETDGRYMVGVKFLRSEDAFRSRMVQQVCAIERYRRKVARSEGRELTSTEAAAEWIARYGERFPA